MDLTQAYYHMAVHPDTRKYLGMEYQGKFYRWEALPFGLNVAPREWQRAMNAVVAHLRVQGILVWVYIDDFIVLGATREIVGHHTRKLLALLRRLGLSVNIKKSVLDPTQLILFLGFLVDLENGRISVPPSKLKAITADVRRIRESPRLTVRKLASILGTLRSLAPAVPHVRILSDIVSTLVGREARRGWDRIVVVPDKAVEQLMHTETHLRSWRGHEYILSDHVMKIYTDASEEGWGAVVPMHPNTLAWGWFRKEKGEHINVKEFLAGVNALKAYALTSGQLHFYTDSMTLYWYLKKWGGRKEHLNDIIRELWTFCQDNDLTITPFYVPSLLNPADAPARRPWGTAQATLHKWTFEKITSFFDLKPAVDWMADSDNKVCRRFGAETPQDKAEFIDIFEHTNLRSISPGWVNPPWALIPQLLQFLRDSEGAEALLLVPTRPKEAWWHWFQELLVGPPLHLPWTDVGYLDLDGQWLQGQQALTCGHVCSHGIGRGELPVKRQKLS